MSIHTDVGFSTGLYTVKRDPGGSWVEGRFVEAARTVIPGVDMAEVPEGDTSSEQTQGTEVVEFRTLYTDFQLLGARRSADVSGQPGDGLQADLVVIDGEDWIVRTVKHYGLVSGHYVATVERLNSRAT